MQHIPGIANRVADYLSRPSTWGSALRPAEIKEGEISQSQVRDAEFCPLPPPGLRPELWGADSRRHARSGESRCFDGNFLFQGFSLLFFCHVVVHLLRQDLSLDVSHRLPHLAALVWACKSCCMRMKAFLPVNARRSGPGVGMGATSSRSSLARLSRSPTTTSIEPESSGRTEPAGGDGPAELVKAPKKGTKVGGLKRE